MSQCVPSWEINGTTSANPRNISRRAAPQFNSNISIPHVPSMLDEGHEVAAAELMWEKGGITLQEIAANGKTTPPILFPSPEEDNFNFRYEFEKPRAGGTLESVVNPVVMAKDTVAENLFPWLYDHHGGGPAANLTAAMDALVPCSAAQVPDSGCSVGVGSCSGRDHREGRKRRRNETREESSAARVPSSEWSDTFEWESEQISDDTSETERETGTWGFTSTSITCGSPENTSSADQHCSTDDYDDSACHQKKREVRVESMKKSNVKSSIISSERISRTAFSSTDHHDNHSEQGRRRRSDKMRERMGTLKKMVPNLNKVVDRVEVLDEVIEYLRQLQSQVEMLNRHQHQHLLQLQMMLNMMMMMSMSMSMSVPTGFMGMGSIGMGVGLDPNVLARFSSSVPTRHAGPFNDAVPTPSRPVDFMNNTTTNSPFLMHTDPISMFLAYQSQYSQQY